jgi:hypothetical protein
VTQNRIIGLLAACLGGVIFLLSMSLPSPVLGGNIGPSFFPKIWGGTLVLLGLILVLSTFFMRSTCPAGPRSSLREWWDNYRFAVYMFLLAAGYFLLMSILGFLFSTLLFLPAGILILEKRTRKNCILATLVTLGISVGTYSLFYYGMHVFLPPPVWQ